MLLVVEEGAGRIKRRRGRSEGMSVEVMFIAESLV